MGKMIKISKVDLNFLLECAYLGNVEGPGTTIKDYEKMMELIKKYKDIWDGIGL